MKDPHQNIFYYYRGPTTNKSKESIYDKQIENNTTKSLINILEFCSKDKINLVKEFLSKIDISIKDFSDIKYILQIKQDESIPDACIKIGEKKIFIEAKVGADISMDQIKKHIKPLRENFLVIITEKNEREKLKDLERGGRIKIIRWGDIYEIMKELKAKYGGLESFLLSQFLEYLEFTGLSTFQGFDEKDFIYFKEKSLEFVPNTKRRLEELSILVEKDIEKDVKINERKQGNIKNKDKDDRDTIWIALKPKVPKKFKNCNFTLELSKEGLLVNLVIRDGRIDQNKPIGLFFKKILSQKEKFANQFRLLEKDCYIKIFERIPKNYSKKGKPIFRGRETWKLIDSYSTKDPDDIAKFYAQIEESYKNQDKKFYGIHIGNLIKIDDPILKDKAKLSVEIGNKIKSYYPLFNEIIKINFFSPPRPPILFV